MASWPLSLVPVIGLSQQSARSIRNIIFHIVFGTVCCLASVRLGVVGFGLVVRLLFLVVICAVDVRAAGTLSPRCLRRAIIVYTRVPVILYLRNVELGAGTPSLTPSMVAAGGAQHRHAQVRDIGVVCASNL